MRRVEDASRWVYQGLWGILAKWLRVPREPPTLPVAVGETLEAFQPAEGFLRYLKFWFWIGLTLIDVLILVGWIVITVASPLIGVITAVPALLLAVVPDVVAYLAIHLRYDTTWYVISENSLRTRRGIWVIHETTITFENVQNVTVRQGPLQRWFRIADVHVDTAGGGGSSQAGEHGISTRLTHHGLIEGISDATRIRDLLLARLRKSRSAGLGDEVQAPAAPPQWRAEHLAALRDIRDVLQDLATRRRGAL